SNVQNAGFESREPKVPQSSPRSPHPAALFEDVTEKAGFESDEEERPRWASGAAWGDYDNDSKLDIYVCYYAVWSPRIDRPCPRPDGGIGLCVPTVYDGDTDRLYRNEGDGRFRDVTKQAGIDRERRRGLAVAWLDYNGDGYADIYVANDMDPNLLWRNNGDGTFTEVAGEAGAALGADGVAASGMGIAVGDYENKGRESLFVTNLNGEVYSLFRNEGGGLFSYASDRACLFLPTISTAGWGVAFFDFDRDGWLDIITGNSHVDPEVDRYVPGIRYEEPKGLYRNTQRGTFTDVTAQSGALAQPRATRGLAVGDYDNDGRPDVLCVNRNDRADLFRNVSPDKNHWITLRLVGVKSNRDGAGAKVWVTAGGIRHYAECRLGSSYASSSDKRLHIGLGTATTVEKLEILWPSRQRDTYRGVEVDRFYVVTEGKGYAPEK
ncbi:MAG TPA: CRTAC1 family protein, partial [Chthonomonadales bacterium]|nr:CRTAC1 family protein [Chthonomonadales bacterium]